ncbi:MAG: HD domain-containing protein [Lachnospiraceae bacterium]|nr:HD domain-containing protein [Lachnospiraceae bacterium]
MEANNILSENEKQANGIVAKVMATTFLIFTVIYILNLCDVFIIKPEIMNTAYVCSAFLLLLPMFLNNVFKVEKACVKYINVMCAVLFVMLLSITLTYHVVVIYVYPIAIASLYFSKKLNIVATIFTVLGVSVGQIMAFYMDTVKDDNFETLYKAVIWGIIPRAMVLTAIAVIFTMLCSRTVALLKKLMTATEDLEHYHREMVMGFATLVENKDGSTGGHIRRTSLYVKLLADELLNRGCYKDELNREYIEMLSKAAPMHDIGKIAVPDVILQKPGKLTDEEFEAMKSHTLRGGEIIRETFGHLEDKAYTRMAYEVARFHHEKWNGRGYPEGLKGEEIPLCARIMAIADVFDAVSEKRCYRDAMPMDKCFKIIEEGSGESFDPVLAEVFVSIRENVEWVHEKVNQENTL